MSEALREENLVGEHPDVVRQDAMAFRSQAIESAQRARTNVAAVSGHEVHYDDHGTLLIDRDRQELRENGAQK